MRPVTLTGRQVGLIVAALGITQAEVLTNTNPDTPEDDRARLAVDLDTLMDPLAAALEDDDLAGHLRAIEELAAAAGYRRERIADAPAPA